MNYELFMGEALAEARLAAERGEQPSAAVAVVNDAMVARAHDRVRETNDPTAHAVIVALREAARRLGTAQLGDVTVFATLEQLQTLDGVGPATAQKIVAYRTEHGGFRSIDDLANVPGIGPKRLAALKPHVQP